MNEFDQESTLVKAESPVFLLEKRKVSLIFHDGPAMAAYIFIMSRPDSWVFDNKEIEDACEFTPNESDRHLKTLLELGLLISGGDK